MALTNGVMSHDPNMGGKGEAVHRRPRGGPSALRIRTTARGESSPAPRSVRWRQYAFATATLGLGKCRRSVGSRIVPPADTIRRQLWNIRLRGRLVPRMEATNEQSTTFQREHDGI
jgi:hypothetical protein